MSKQKCLRSTVIEDVSVDLKVGGECIIIPPQVDLILLSFYIKVTKGKVPSWIGGRIRGVTSFLLFALVGHILCSEILTDTPWSWKEKWRVEGRARVG